MYELEELDSEVTDRLQEGGSIREALEDGRLQPVPLALPKPERRRQQDTTLKLMATALIASLVAMMCYVAWRIRDIEKVSEASDYDYCLIGTEDFNNDDKVDSTCDRDFKSAG